MFPHSSDAWHATALAANHQANADSPDLWIYKPSTGSCGQGVVVGSAPVIAELLATDGVAGHAAVVQRYEASPRLIAGPR